MNTEMFEVGGTSYSTKTALYECNMVRDRYIDFAVLNGYTENTIRLIYQVMSVKSKSLSNQFLELEQAYPLLKSREGFNY